MTADHISRGWIPQDDGRLRWYDGKKWTAFYAERDEDKPEKEMTEKSDDTTLTDETPQIQNAATTGTLTQKVSITTDSQLTTDMRDEKVSLKRWASFSMFIIPILVGGLAFWGYWLHINMNAKTSLGAALFIPTISAIFMVFFFMLVSTFSRKYPIMSFPFFLWCFLVFGTGVILYRFVPLWWLLCFLGLPLFLLENKHNITAHLIWTREQ